MFPRNKPWQRLPGIEVLAFCSTLLATSTMTLDRSANFSGHLPRACCWAPGHGDEDNGVPLLEKHP